MSELSNYLDIALGVVREGESIFTKNILKYNQLEKNIEREVKDIVKQLGITSLVGKSYLPIGSSIILDKGEKSLVISPTMLLPQNVSSTKNAYYSTKSVLYNIDGVF